MAPEYVDLQVNGFGGVDFSSPDLTSETFAEACCGLFARGTAKFLPTLVTSPESTYRRNLPIIAEALTDRELGPRIPGIHLEGPFISSEPGAVGAHNPQWVRAPDIALFNKLQEWSGNNIRLLTVAAEVDGVDELIRCATSAGVIVSLGHQLATKEALERAADAGATCLTHLGNGVPNEMPRHPNPIWDGLAEDRLFMTVIADGHHVPPHVLKSMIRAKGIERTIIVSDAASIAGMPPGRYNAHGNEVILEENGLLHNPVKGCLVGSSATIRECVSVLEAQDWLSEDQILEMTVRNPRRLIGLDPC